MICNTIFKKIDPTQSQIIFMSYFISMVFRWGI